MSQTSRLSFPSSGRPKTWPTSAWTPCAEPENHDASLSDAIELLVPACQRYVESDYQVPKYGSVVLPANLDLPSPKSLALALGRASWTAGTWTGRATVPSVPEYLVMIPGGTPGPAAWIRRPWPIGLLPTRGQTTPSDGLSVLALRYEMCASVHEPRVVRAVYDRTR